MNTTQIKYFLAAARTLNFTEAASQLYISQPALSKQITAIENELNMMLFVRSKLDFDIMGIPGLHHETIATCPAIAAVSKSHPLAANPPANWSDLKGQTFIVIEEKDCFASSRMVSEDCKRAGFTPIFKYAPSLETAMLWIEAGMGVGFVNTMNNLTMNPNICLLSELPCKNTYSVLAWKHENINPAIALFTNFISNNQ